MFKPSIANIPYPHVASASRFDWLMAGLGWWLEGGLILDIWAHAHNFVDGAFFTVWHWLFYSGFFAVAIALVTILISRRSTALSWKDAIPEGYEFAMGGILLFAISGLSDFIWHTHYGFDLASDAPISPSHLGIVLGIGMIVSGPFRAAQRVVTVPALMSALSLLTIATTTIQFSHPTAKIWADPAIASRFLIDPTLAQSLALTGMMIHTVLWVGFVLALLQRWHLPLGTVALLLVSNAILMLLAHDQYRLLPAAVLAGIGAEAIIWYSLQHKSQFTAVLGAGIPLIYYSAYFLILYFLQRLWWQPHVWMGGIVLCSLAGWLIGGVMKNKKQVGTWD